MEVVEATQINSLPSYLAQAHAHAPPEDEPVFILTASQLKEIISQAIQPLQDEVSQLREERAQDQAEFERFRTTHKQFAVQTGKDIDALFESNLRPTGTPEVKPTQKTQDNITRIALILSNKEQRLIEGQAPLAYVTRLRKEGMTFSQLANAMGLTVDRIRQLSRIAAGDQRFNVTWHPRRKNTKIIKLRRWDAPGL